MQRVVLPQDSVSTVIRVDDEHPNPTSLLQLLEIEVAIL
jgi:hypothetical protein